MNGLCLNDHRQSVGKDTSTYHLDEYLSISREGLGGFFLKNKKNLGRFIKKRGAGGATVRALLPLMLIAQRVLCSGLPTWMLHQIGRIEKCVLTDMLRRDVIVTIIGPDALE